MDAESVKGGLEVTQVNINDGTVEGLSHREYPLLTIQYHSEASPGHWIMSTCLTGSWKWLVVLSPAARMEP